MRIETTININRPAEEVMEFVTKIENLPIWVENVIQARQTSHGPVGQGTTCRIVSEVMSRRLSHDFAVTEFRPGQRYAAHSVGGPFPMSMMYNIEPSEDGSRLHSVSEVELTGLMALTASAHEHENSGPASSLTTATSNASSNPETTKCCFPHHNSNSSTAT